MMLEQGAPLGPYRFELTKTMNIQGYYNVSEGSQTRRHIGTFTVKDRQIQFEWKASTAGPDLEMRNRLCDCVLVFREQKLAGAAIASETVIAAMFGRQA